MPRRSWTSSKRKEVTGKPDDIERVTSGLAGGRRERSRKTTSPAAYPTTSMGREFETLVRDAVATNQTFAHFLLRLTEIAGK